MLGSMANATPPTGRNPHWEKSPREKSMYGLIGNMRSVPGKRDELLHILFEVTTALPGCLNYVIACDPGDTTAIWITEVWTDAASHKASLALPEVRTAITKA